MSVCIAFLMATNLGIEQVPLDTAMKYHSHAVEPRRFVRKIPTTDSMLTCITEKYIDSIVSKKHLWRK
jgi:hypothetical protein